MTIKAKKISKQGKSSTLAPTQADQQKGFPDTEILRLTRFSTPTGSKTLDN